MRVAEVEARSVLNRHRRRDGWFLDDYSVNPYYGCPLGCVYCYVRGSRYGARRPPGVAAKVNAPGLLDRQLASRARRGQYGFVALGTATEPYMPPERELRLTRRVLGVLTRWRFPVHVLTKSPLVVRDADLLAEVAEKAVLPRDLEGSLPGVAVTVSISTLDEEVARIFEPGAPPPEDRLGAVGELAAAGVRAGVAYIPVLPFISDSERDVAEMVAAAREAGADYVFVGALTLHGEGREAFYSVLRARFPELLPRYRALFRGRMAPTGSYQERLARAARRACEEAGIRLGLI